MFKIWECFICRILIYIAGALLGIIVTIFIFINPLLNAIVKPEILDSVNRNNKIALEIEDMHFSPALNSLFIGNLNFSHYDSSDSAKDSIAAASNLISFAGINWVELFSGNYSFDELIIKEPLIIVKRENRKTGRKSNTSDSNSPWGKQLSKLLPERFKFSKIVVDSGRFINQSKSGEENINDTINSFSFIISDFAPDKWSKELNLFEDFELKIKDFHRRWNKSGYDFKIKTINASGKRSSLVIDSISFIPFISDQEFFNRRSYRDDRWKISIPELNLEGIDFQKILAQNKISVKTITPRNFNIEIFTNKRLPFDPQADPKMPHELMSSLNFDLEVEKIEINNGLVTMQSLMPHVERRAELKFSNISGAISNISNSSENQNKQNKCEFNLSAKLQDTGEINIKMNLPLTSDNLTFDYKGSLEGMSATKLNSHVEVEDLINIEAGEITNISFSTDVKRSIAAVNIIPIYSDLKIEALDKEAEGESVLQSTIMNAVLRKANPNEDGKIKSGNVTYIAKPKDAFLDVVWQALLKGLGEVVGF
jgi:hypothetical protein